jgi:archaellum biogenesis ATPase FlaH
LAVTILDTIQTVDRTARHAAVVVDDLAPLIDRYGLQATFQLMHVVTGACRDREITLRVGIDRSAVDESVLATIAPLFDTVE